MIINWQSLDHTTIRYCHSKGMKVFTYTVDTVDQIQDFEVDGVVFNKIFHYYNNGCAAIKANGCKHGGE